MITSQSCNSQSQSKIALTQAVPLVFSLDLRTLGITRILFGLALLLSEYFIYVEKGWDLSSLAVFISTTAFIVGIFTPLSTFLTWVGFFYANSLLSLPDYGMDIARNMLFFGIFIPMGSYFSLDSFFNSRRSAANVTPPKISSYATAAWVLQFFFIYFSGGITKNPEHWFWYPHAVHRLLSGSKFPTEIGALLANYPNISACLTVTTYLMEIAVPFLLFIPDPGGRPRTIFSLLFILFHFGLALTMKLNAFPFVCMALLPSLFPWSLSVFRRSNEGTDERGAKEQVVVVPPNILQRFIALTIVFMVIANIRTILGDTSPYEFGTPGWFFSRVLGLSQHWVMFNIVSG